MRADGIFGEAVDRIGGEPISARMARKAPIRHIDPTLLLVTLFLSAYGAVMVLSVANGISAGILLTLGADLADRRNPAEEAADFATRIRERAEEQRRRYEAQKKMDQERDEDKPDAE